MPRNPDIPRVNHHYLHRPARPGGGEERIRLDSNRWFEWLEREETRSFAFEGASGRFTARKENKKRGNEYWYAYRWLNGKTTKAYLGVSRNLTKDKLDEAAAKLARRRSKQRRNGLNHHKTPL